MVALNKIIPSPSLPLVNPQTGNMNPTWYNYFQVFATSALTVVSGTGYLVTSVNGIQTSQFTSTGQTINIIDGTGVAGSTNLDVNQANLALGSIGGNLNYSQLTPLVASSLLGNPATGSTYPSAISLGSTLAFTGNQLQTAALTGAITSAANSFITTLSSGVVGTNNLASGAVTYNIIQNESASTLLGNPTSSSASPSEISLGTKLSFSGSTLNVTAAAQGANGDITSLTGLTGPIKGATALTDSSGNDVLSLTYASNAVNYLNILNGATGNGIGIFAAGSDPNIAMTFRSIGTGNILLESQATTNQFQFYTGSSYQYNTTFNFPSSSGSSTITVPASTGTLVLTSTSDPVLQRVSTVVTSTSTGTTTIPINTSAGVVPTTSQGTQFLSLSITPKSATSILKFTGQIQGSASVASYIAAILCTSSSSNSLATFSAYTATTSVLSIIPINFSMTSGTTSTLTFTVRMGLSTAGTVTFNAANTIYGGGLTSSLHITEYTS